MTHKEFYEKLGNKPQIIEHDLGCQRESCDGCSGCNTTRKTIYPDFVSDTPNAKYNCYLLEECILKEYNPPRLASKHQLQADVNVYSLVCSETGYTLWDSEAESRPLALLNLAIQIAEEIKSEVQKQEFIY